MDLTVVNVAFAIPRLLVIVGLIVALALAIARRSSLGRASALAIAGIALIVLVSLLDVAVGFAPQLEIFDDSDSIILFFAVHNAVSGVLWGAGLALVIAAVFIGRRGPAVAHGGVAHGAVTPGPDRTAPPFGPLP